MTDPHHTRAHAQWSASATARNVTCAGAIAMTTIAPPDVESEAAAWGTAAHQVAEKCLRAVKNPWEFLGDTIKTKKFEFTFDDEMCRCVEEYTDYIWSRVHKYETETGDKALVWIEMHFSFDNLNPPFEAGGTGDAVLYFPLWKMIEIVDLKGGRGVIVEVKNNFQARSYALGALLAFPDLDIDIVRSTIVQPRAPHPDGRIRSEEIHVAELVDWTHDLRAAMGRSKQALDEFEALTGNSVAFDEWVARWLAPGQCTFCPAKAICPTLKKQALATAGVWFDDLDAPHIGNTVPIESAEALGKTLDGLEMLEDWIAAVRANAHLRAENGETIPGWMLVDKIGHRAWLGELTATRNALRRKLKLTNADILVEPKLKSPAQIEKTLGKRKKELAALEGVLWEKPVKGTNLVSVDKTTRTPAKPKAEQHFEEIK